MKRGRRVNDHKFNRKNYFWVKGYNFHKRREAAMGGFLVSAGVAAIIGSIALGVLSEISLSVSKTNTSRVDTSTILRRAVPDDPEDRIKRANREPPYDD